MWLNCGGTFPHVAKIAYVHLFLSMIVVRHCPIYELNIKNVFLYDDIDDEVYIQQPLCFVAEGMSSGSVCRSYWSLYGLKQSPQA